jgi:hypothetical protein
MDLAAGLQGVVQQAAQLTVQEGDEQPQQEPPFQWHAAADPDPAVTAAVEAALAAGIDDVAMRAMSGQQYEPEELSKAFTQAMAGALDPDQQIWVHTDSDRLPSAAPAAAVAGSSDNSLQQQRRDRQALLQALSSCMPQTSDAVQAACANASYNERCHVSLMAAQQWSLPVVLCKHTLYWMCTCTADGISNSRGCHATLKLGAMPLLLGSMHATALVSTAGLPALQPCLAHILQITQSCWRFYFMLGAGRPHCGSADSPSTPSPLPPHPWHTLLVWACPQNYLAIQVLWSVGGGVGVLAGILNAKLSSPDAQSPAQN